MRSHGIDFVCVEEGCRTTFRLEPDTLEWYRTKGFRVPRRCPAHRAAKRPLRGGLWHVLGGEYQKDAGTILLYTKHNA